MSRQKEEPHLEFVNDTEGGREQAGWLVRAERDAGPYKHDEDLAGIGGERLITNGHSFM